jgi:hypothetical protein
MTATASEQIENVTRAYRQATDFDKSLAVGQLVGVCWTASHLAFLGRARIVKLNAKSVVTELLAPVTVDDRQAPYPVGHRITAPRIGDRKWSESNRVEPFPRLWGVFVEVFGTTRRSARVVNPLAYDPALRDLLKASEVMEVSVPLDHCVGIVAVNARSMPQLLPMLIVREKRCATCYWTGLQSADVERIEQRLNVAVDWGGFALADLRAP